MNKAIHYSPRLKLTILKSEGEGQCGKTGLISGYEGMITCKRCKQLFNEEKKAGLPHQTMTSFSMEVA